MNKRDTTGDVCKVCNKGKMFEGCIEDDWDGTLTCTNCKVKQLRYELVQEKENNDG